MTTASEKFGCTLSAIPLRPCSKTWVPARDAQIFLGHAHVTTTQQIYTHVDEAARLDAITKLNKLLGGSNEPLLWSALVVNGPFQGSGRIVCLVELRGLEPLTPCLQSRCSSS